MRDQTIPGHSITDFSQTSTDVATLQKALAAAYEAMNYMGDVANEAGFTQPEDVAFVSPRFEVVRAALGVD